MIICPVQSQGVSKINCNNSAINTIHNLFQIANVPLIRSYNHKTIKSLERPEELLGVTSCCHNAVLRLTVLQLTLLWSQSFCVCVCVWEREREREPFGKLANLRMIRLPRELSVLVKGPFYFWNEVLMFRLTLAQSSAGGVIARAARRGERLRHSAHISRDMLTLRVWRSLSVIWHLIVVFF